MNTDTLVMLMKQRFGTYIHRNNIIASWKWQQKSDQKLLHEEEKTHRHKSALER